MFQPQPTPFASFASPSYGINSSFGFGLPLSAGGGGAGPAGSGLRYGSLPASTPPTAPHPRHIEHLRQQLQQQQQQHQHQHQHQHQQQQQHQHQHQQQHQHQRQHQQQHQQQQQHLQLRQLHQLQQLELGHCHNNHHHPNYSSLAIMEDHQQQQQDAHDVASQQAAAKDYQPVLEGPLVGEKTPSDAITHEYAKADPVYVEKTIALPQTYSHYRPIQGDGNCGWRAIGFSYFEKLVESGDQAQIEGQVARLISLNQMLATVGGYTYFEDWADEAIGLLRDLAANIGDPDMAYMILHQRWNDESVASGIIYYLRLLAATYLKANAATYDPFIPDGLGVENYCSHSIELVNREIEQLGIVALVNMLLKPVNFVLEIAYLDRSPGSSVNRYRFPEEANGQDPATLGPMIHLLYRPDHYDILYCAPPAMPPAGGPITMQVNRVTGFSHNTDITSTHTDLGAFSTMDFGALAMIPGLNPTMMSGISPLASPPPSAGPIHDSFSSAQQGSWMSQFADGLPSSASSPHTQQPPVVAPPAPPTPSTPLTPTTPMGGPSSLAVGTQPGMVPNPAVASGGAYRIRFSPVQLDYDESKNTFPEPTFQVTTSTFKNSVWNRAHYGNPDFHPEEWSPEDEGIDGRLGARRRARKDS